MFKYSLSLVMLLGCLGCTKGSTPVAVPGDGGGCTIGESTPMYCETVDCAAGVSMDSCGTEHQPSDCPAQCGDAGVESCESLWAAICEGHCDDTVQEAPRCGVRTMNCPSCPSK